MLVEVQCDKFIKHGEIRKPIQFHAGLNTVIGDDNGSNSVGKSTFLMILDFVFGGKDYVNKCLDVQENVGEHTINFTFVFDGKAYHFSRSNIDYKHVFRCNENYEPLSEDSKMTLDQYCGFLAEKYGTQVEEDLTWRGVVSRFIRVWKRDTLDEERPLRAAKDEKAEYAIKRYMQLYGKFAPVEAQIKQAKAAEEERDAFKKSSDYKHIRAAKNKPEYEDNEKRIAALRTQEQELAEQSNKGLLDLDSFQARHLSELDDQLLKYRRERARVQTQLNAIRREMTEGKKSFKKTYSDLEKFFPGVDFQTIESIESFHQQLAKVLGDEFKETEKDLATAYVMLGNEIARILEEVEEIKKIPNVSEAILKEYAKITTELNNLIDANRNYDRMNELNDLVAEYAETRDRVIRDQLFAIETMLNQKMREISVQLLKDEQHMPPVLRMEKLNKYTFNTPNDGGTGAQYRGVITFDLANMELSPLPFIIHDMQMLLHIEKKVMAEIIKAYDAQKKDGKQVFIAFDRLDTYDTKTKDTMNTNCVLELSPGGNELFGRAWNKETEKKEDGE